MSAISDEYPMGPQGAPHPEVFDIRAMPAHQLPLKPGQMDQDKIKHYFEKGYLIVPDFFKKEELDACRSDVEGLVDDLAKSLYEAGKIKDLYADKGLFERLVFLEKDYPGTNVILHKKGFLPKAFGDLWSNERLLNVVEQLIGPEIMGHPVWNLRTKTPQNEATTVPWHQDSGYLDNNSYEVLQVTAWIPLVNATKHNGCMEVVSGGHRHGKVAKHTCCWGNTWYIVLDEKDMEKDLDVKVERDKVLCEIPYGGMLLLNNMIPHHSLNNLSDGIRWSIDLRFQRPDKALGFYGLKDGVMLRSKANPVQKIDWERFNKTDRSDAQDKDCKGAVPEDPFDTSIAGPWMKKWEMTHQNQHTDKLKRNDVSWTKA